jgi:hypothetical protein
MVTDLMLYCFIRKRTVALLVRIIAYNIMKGKKDTRELMPGHFSKDSNRKLCYYARRMQDKTFWEVMGDISTVSSYLYIAELKP